MEFALMPPPPASTMDEALYDLIDMLMAVSDIRSVHVAVVNGTEQVADSQEALRTFLRSWKDAYQSRFASNQSSNIHNTFSYALTLKRSQPPYDISEMSPEAIAKLSRPELGLCLQELDSLVLTGIQNGQSFDSILKHANVWMETKM